jgi:PEP-CTERM motif
MMKTDRVSSRFCTVIFVAGCTAAAAFGQAGTVYNNIPANPSTSASSLGYAANFATQFGGIISPDYSVFGNNIFSATVELANFALAGGSETIGYNVPLTLNLYNVNLDGSVGSLFAQGATDALINWATNSGGDMQAVTIGIAAPNAPSTFIYGLSFTPSGPSNSLNFALSGQYDTTGTFTLGGVADTTTVGRTLAYACTGGPNTVLPSTVYCDTAYWDSPNTSNTTNTGFAQDNGFVSGGFGAGLIEFSASPIPEPATFGILGLGLIALGAVARKRTRA